MSKLVPQLKLGEDYTIDEKQKTVAPTEAGVSKMEKMLKVDNLYDTDNLELNHLFVQALRAQAMMERDRDYVVKDGEVVIVDEFTGRLMYGRRYSDGLHQAIEAKEGLQVQRESQTLATITFQNYFRMYDKLAGMTGAFLPIDLSNEKICLMLFLRRNVASTGQLSVKLKGVTLPGSQCLSVQRLLSSRNN